MEYIAKVKAVRGFTHKLYWKPYNAHKYVAFSIVNDHTKKGEKIVGTIEHNVDLPENAVKATINDYPDSALSLMDLIELEYKI